MKYHKEDPARSISPLRNQIIGAFNDKARLIRILKCGAKIIVLT